VRSTARSGKVGAMADEPAYTAETNILKAIEGDERVAEVLKQLGLKCIDRRGELCVAAEVESFGDAALYHEMPLDRILDALNRLGPPPPRRT
jgi:hypothetical protein